MWSEKSDKKWQKMLKTSLFQKTEQKLNKNWTFKDKAKYEVREQKSGKKGGQKRVKKGQKVAKMGHFRGFKNDP